MNRLATEKSPYLLQHAGDPVDWYPWGEEAFQRARELHRPIFLSIGYATCHWCHVMERESFSSPAVAALLDRGFVPVKVDREERPDVDRLYMAFVQGLTGSGGWPLSVFLTPERRPFYGGTYFPVADSHGRPGFAGLLERLAGIWAERREEVEASAGDIAARLAAALAPSPPAPVPADAGATLVARLEAARDREHGGFGGAPKFPQAPLLALLLRRAAGGDRVAGEAALAQLHAMRRGGIHDHLGGGFHRYAVDRDWHVPHFEKMLADQAQLIDAYLGGGLLSGDATLLDTARSTAAYVVRDLAAPGGGFFGAEDADSDRDGSLAEGAFYVWRAAEILDALASGDAGLVLARYGVLDTGNTEDPELAAGGWNVLHLAGDPSDGAEAAILQRARGRLLAVRAGRPRPRRDEKIVASWNGLVIGALARAGRALGEPALVAAAGAAARRVVATLWDGRELRRRWAGGEVGGEAGLEDYAALAGGLIALAGAGGGVGHLLLAERLLDRMLELFAGPAGRLFATSGRDPSLLLRLADDYEGAEPAGVTLAVEALLAAGRILERPDLAAAAAAAREACGEILAGSPQALPRLLATLEVEAPLVTVFGELPAAVPLLEAAHRRLPAAAVLHVDAEAVRLLGARLPAIAAARLDPPSAVACQGGACGIPITDAAALAALPAPLT